MTLYWLKTLFWAEEHSGKKLMLKHLLSRMTAQSSAKVQKTMFPGSSVLREIRSGRYRSVSIIW